MANKIILVRVSAPHFCAGLEIHDGKIAIAAPIIAWMKKNKMTEEQIVAYCIKKKWDCQIKYIEGLFK